MSGPNVAPAATAQRWRARQFHNQPVESHLHGFLVDLWAAVREETGGRLEVSVHQQNAGVPGSDPQALQMLMSGELEFQSLMGGILAQHVPAADLQAVPFAYLDHRQVHAAMAGDLGDYIRNEMRARGIHGFRHGVLENGFRQMFGCARPIRGAADLEGFRMRIPQGRMFQEVFEALGAPPVTVNINGLYAALADGTVDGHENPLVVHEVNRLYEVSRYISVTNHMWSGFNLIANLAFWNGLPEYVRAVVERNVKLHCDRQRAYTDRFNREALARLERDRGMQVNHADGASFRQRLAGDFYRRWRDEFGSTAWGLLEAQAGRLA